MKLNSEFFESLVNVIGGGIVVANDSGETVYVNPAMHQMLGYQEGEMIGKNVKEFTDPSDVKSTIETIKESIANPGYEVQLEKVYLNKNGEKSYGLTTVKSQKFEGELFLFAFINDFSDQYIARQRVEKQYRNIVESADDVIFTVDVEGNFLYSNKMTQEITGLTVKEITKKNYLEVVAPSHFEEVKAFYSDHFKSRADKSQFTFPVLHTDGNIRWLDQKLSTIWDDGRKVILGYSAVARNVTAEVEIAQRLRESESHYQAVFDQSPIPKRMEDFSQVKVYIEKLRSSGIQDFDKYFTEHPEEVKKCVGLVKVIEKNKQVLVLHDAKSEEELNNNISQVFTEQAFEAFKLELIGISKGETVFETKTIVRTLKGEERHVQLKWMVMPGYEKSLEKVMITTVDITDIIQSDRALKESQKHYEGLFNDSPVPLWLEDLSEVMNRIEELRVEGVTNFRRYLEDNIDEVMFLSEKVKVLQVNQEVLHLHEASSEEELLMNFNNIFTEDSLLAFRDELLNLIEGKESVGVDCQMKTVTGKDKVIRMQWSLMVGHERSFDRVLVSSLDVTKEYRNQKEIKESQERLSTVFENISVPIIISNPNDAQIVKVNRMVCESLGYREDELLSMKIHDLDQTHNDVYVIKALQRCFREGLVKGETKWVTKYGEVRNITVRNSLIRIAGEDRILSACADVTEVKKLHVENERFRIVMEDAPFAIYITDVESNKLIDVNATACEQLGYSKSELLSLSPSDIEQTDLMQNEQERINHFETLIENQSTMNIEGVHRRKDGSSFPVKVTVNARNIYGKEYIIASVFDNTFANEVTEQLKEQNKALTKFQAELNDEIELRKKVEQNLIDTEEKERKRMARELHDGLGQKLTAAKYSVGAIKMSMRLRDEESKILDESIKIIEETMKEVREISHNLSPSVLSDFGLVAALSKICGRVDDLYDFTVSFTSEGDLPSIDEHVETSLYRIAQEAINNAIKYSQGDTIEVQLLSDENFVLLKISDDGSGFEVRESTKKGGMGIVNIEERCKMIKAECKFSSTLGKGTTLTISYNIQ